MAAAEMSERSPSCCSDRPLSWRSWRIFGPIDWMIWPSSSCLAGGASGSGAEAARRARRLACFAAGAPASARALVLSTVRRPLSRIRDGCLDGQTPPSSISDGAFIIVNPSQPVAAQGGRMPPRIVVVGGGAAGIGAAGSAKQADPQAAVTVYTEYEDAAYSPCGIPYVHGREIPDFQRLFLQEKAAY